MPPRGGVDRPSRRWRGRLTRGRAAAAEYTGQPRALAEALQKIESWSHQVPMTHGSPAVAHMYISNPFSGGWIASMFSTHPPTAERVARLQAMNLSR